MCRSNIFRVTLLLHLISFEGPARSFLFQLDRFQFNCDAISFVGRQLKSSLFDETDDIDSYLVFIDPLKINCNQFVSHQLMFLQKRITENDWRPIKRNSQRGTMKFFNKNQCESAMLHPNDTLKGRKYLLKPSSV